MDILAQAKTCGTCARSLPLSDFSRDRTKADGLRTTCKACKSQRDREYREKNADGVKARKQQYYQENKAAITKSHQRYREANTEAEKVRHHAYYECNKERLAEQNRRWASAHPDKVLEAGRRYRANHPERSHGPQKPYDPAYYQANKDKRRQSAQRWQAKNRDKVYDKKRRYCVRKVTNGGTHTLEEWTALKARYDFRCLKCGRQEPRVTLERDHVLPVTSGGTDEIENIQPLCRSCNASKYTQHIDFR